MFLKLIPPGDEQPGHNGKPFHLIEVCEARFERDGDAVYVHAVRNDGAPIALQVNGAAFILNAEGNTIESFRARQDRKG